MREYGTKTTPVFLPGKKQINHSIAFEIFISGINNQNLTFQKYRQSTYTGLLLNFKSLTSF